MTTLRNMLGAVRRKEKKASGSAPYHPTHRDRIIKAKLGFLEKHIRTRKSVSTLPEVSLIVAASHYRMDKIYYLNDDIQNNRLNQQAMTQVRHDRKTYCIQ